MGSGTGLNKVVSPGGKGFKAGGDPMANDPFLQNYGLKSQGFINTFTPLFGSALATGMLGNKSYTPPGYDQRMATYEAQRQALDAQAAQNLALRQNYSLPYVDNFQQFTGNYSYQQPYYTPPPQQFYSPPQQYYSPYMNQFQMAGSQFYQQPYSYQPSPYYQPFMQPGGRSQYFAQRGKGGFY